MGNDHARAKDALPGVDTRPRKPYSGGPLRKFVLGGGAPSAAHVIALKESSKPAARTAPASKQGKKTIEQINAEGINLRLRRAPYSEKSLTDGNFLNLQPHKGGWIVEFQGVYLGSVKRSKVSRRRAGELDLTGWDTSGIMYHSGARAQKVSEATSMLDEYYAAGGK